MDSLKPVGVPLVGTPGSVYLFTHLFQTRSSLFTQPHVRPRSRQRFLRTPIAQPQMRRTSISTSLRRCANCKPAKAPTSTSITMRDHIKVSTIARWRKTTSCSDGGRLHPSGFTLFFPFRCPVIGANHRALPSSFSLARAAVRRPTLGVTCGVTWGVHRGQLPLPGARRSPPSTQGEHYRLGSHKT